MVNALGNIFACDAALHHFFYPRAATDVQYTKLESYQSSDSKEEQNCINVLSDAEKELTKNFKRIVTIGKGSKPVPLLFPKKNSRVH